jgi:hypothetical protein
MVSGNIGATMRLESVPLIVRDRNAEQHPEVKKKEEQPEELRNSLLTAKTTTVRVGLPFS